MSNNQYVQPELKSYAFAVPDYFTRDSREKNAAAIAMALSQLDQNDLWQFAERILVEVRKYDLEELEEKLEFVYYGDGSIPLIDAPHIPFFYLKADSFVTTAKGENLVRIRGLIVDGIVQEVIPWATWQQLKAESSRYLMKIAGEIISEIDKNNNFSAKLAEVLDSISKDIENSLGVFNPDVKSMLDTGFSDEKDRNLENERNDFMTFKRDSPNADNRKYKVFSKDYSYNLQMLISQVFNSNDFNESMFHLSRVVSYLSNTIETRAPKGNIFYVKTKDNLVDPFILLVRHYHFLSEIMNNHQYLTSDERISVSYILQHIKASLQYCQGKILSLVNYIMTLLPKKRTSAFGRASW